MKSCLCVYCFGKGTALPSDPYLQEKFWAKCKSRLAARRLKDMMRCVACDGIGWILSYDS